MIDTLHRPSTRPRRPLLPPAKGFRAPRIRFGIPEIVTAVCSVAAVIGGTLTWISYGDGLRRTALDVPFMFLFRGFDAEDSAITLGLVVMIPAAVALIASASLGTPAFRAVVLACGAVIFAVAVVTSIRIDLAGEAVMGTTNTFDAIGIGTWISGGAGLVMTGTTLVSRFD